MKHQLDNPGNMFLVVENMFGSSSGACASSAAFWLQMKDDGFFQVLLLISVEIQCIISILTLPLLAIEV